LEEQALSTIKEYKLYRQANKQLNSKIISSVPKPAFLRAVKLLGMYSENTLFLESDDELSYAMDFAINDIKMKDKTVAESYQSNVGGENILEEQILAALVLSYTSLFRVVKTNIEKHTIILYDILNNFDIEIIDYHFSMTSHRDTLLFCRILGIDNFNMTSGIGFVYPAGLERYLLSEYEKWKKKMKRHSDNIVRFVSFFRLYMTDGIDVVYIDP
jgi:hypothetical protein